jgi:hypothetical protein
MGEGVAGRRFADPLIQPISSVGRPGLPVAAIAPLHPWSQHPTLKSLQPSLQITADYWALLATSDGSSRKEHYLPKV